MSECEEQIYPDELCESVVDVGSTREEKTAAWTQIMKEEQLLILNHTREREKILIGQTEVRLKKILLLVQEQELLIPFSFSSNIQHQN